MIFKSIYLIAVLELLSNNNNTSINKNYFNYKNNYSSIKKLINLVVVMKNKLLFLNHYFRIISNIKRLICFFI